MAYCIDKRSALRVCYYLMYVDGVITEDESSVFREVVEKTVPEEDVSYIKSLIISDCRSKLKYIEKQDLFRKIYDEINNELNQYGRLDSKIYGWDSDYVKPEWFVWNLLTLAYSDQDYADEQKKIIDLVVRKVGLSEEKYKDFDMLIKCASMIDKEKKWIVSTDKKYEEINRIMLGLDEDMEAIIKQVKLIVYEEED